MVSGRWLSQDFVKKYAEKYEACCTKSTKAVYEDCVKEELEILKKAGEFGGKLCSKVTMEIIKDKLKIG